MALSFPSTDVDGRLIVTGPARVYLGAYTANGVDSVPTLTFLGSTDGGCELHYATSKHPIAVDQYLNDIEAVPIKEEVTVKTRILELNLANLYNILQSTGEAVSTMQLTGGLYASTSSSLTFGEQKKFQYWQLILKTVAPPGATNLTRIYQFWKAYVSATSAIKLEKPKESGLEITWKALTDVSAIAATKAPIFQIKDS